MREDRIVSRSKDGHRYKKKKTVPVLVPIIAAGIIAVTSFNVGAYCERHDIHFFEKKAEQSQPEVQVEEPDYQGTYEQVMRSLNDDKIQEEKRKADEADRMKAKQELNQINDYNENRNQQQVDEFWKYQEEEKNGRGR